MAPPYLIISAEGPCAITREKIAEKEKRKNYRECRFQRINEEEYSAWREWFRGEAEDED